jgi:hypothetical protein
LQARIVIGHSPPPWHRVEDQDADKNDGAHEHGRKPTPLPGQRRSAPPALSALHR